MTFCQICKKEFVRKAGNQSCCSIECFNVHRKAYRKHYSDSRKIERACKQCQKPYFRVLEKSGFCSISCGSKWNIEHKKFETWRLLKIEKQRVEIPCFECGKLLYRTKRKIDSGKRQFCNLKCNGRFNSKLFSGEGNPFFGKKLEKKSLIKQKETLMKNHNVSNAFFLSNRNKLSKPQLMLLSMLTEKFDAKEFKSESLIDCNGKKYYADIFHIATNTVIEFYGDYWHCNPRKYPSTFYHHVKRKTAQEIRDNDALRCQLLVDAGYHVVIIWELDFNADKQNTTQNLVNILSKRLEMHAKKENTNVM